MSDLELVRFFIENAHLINDGTIIPLIASNKLPPEESAKHHK